MGSVGGVALLGGAVYFAVAASLRRAREQGKTPEMFKKDLRVNATSVGKTTAAAASSVLTGEGSQVSGSTAASGDANPEVYDPYRVTCPPDTAKTSLLDVTASATAGKDKSAKPKPTSKVSPRARQQLPGATSTAFAAVTSSKRGDVSENLKRSEDMTDTDALLDGGSDDLIDLNPITGTPIPQSTLGKSARGPVTQTAAELSSPRRLKHKKICRKHSKRSKTAESSERLLSTSEACTSSVVEKELLPRLDALVSTKCRGYMLIPFSLALHVSHACINVHL